MQLQWYVGCLLEGRHEALHFGISPPPGEGATVNRCNTPRPLRIVCAALVALALAACGAEGPSIDPMDNQVAAVGSQLVIEVKASNATGGDISFSYDTNANISAERGGLTQRPGGSAVFSWTPSGQDVGIWTFDFHALDSSGKSTESITVEVKSAVGLDTIPVFRRPLGAGTALDMSKDECVEIEILIEDQDSVRVELTQEEPRIVGAELMQDTDTSGLWRWCPDRAQKEAQERYMLTIGASDGENTRALKHYQIILRQPPGPDCPGEPPEIRHTATNIETVNGIELTADVSDDSGIKGSVNVYYSSTRPSDPPDLTQMILQPMDLSSGGLTQGAWTATLPNPVAAGNAGDSAQIFYVIVADDNDDKGGKCDHSTIASYEILVTNPGGAGGLGSCEPCTTDAQCGGDKDLCLSAGVEGETFCFTHCESTDDCQPGYLCSPSALTSADGNSARQCIPDDGVCAGLPCTDDAYEQNDGITQSEPLAPGSYSGLRMCPFKLYASDDDWFEIEVTEDSTFSASIMGKEDPNIDMRLLDENGTLIAVSENFASVDNLSRCLTPGKYYLRTYSNLFYKSYIGDELVDLGNTYSLTYSLTPNVCETGGTCTDDPFEDDDGIASSQVPDFGGLSETEWNATGRQICESDDDWYYVSAYNNLNHFSIRLDFEQTSAFEDLDILIYDGIGTLLTQCTEQDSSGCTANGQSGDSNEYMVFTPPPDCSLPIDCEGCSPCDYYIVVHGFGGSENEYDICIGYDTVNACTD